MQLHAKPDERGKAVSLYILAMHGGAALGSLASGGVIHLIGVRPTLFVDGIIAVVLQVVVALFVAR